MKDSFQIIHGDCFEVLKTVPDNSIDAVVTDPPYGIRFMGEAWDGEDIEKKVEKRRSQACNDSTCTKKGGHNSIAAEAGKYDFSLKGLKAFEEWTHLWAAEVLRVLKPGGHLVSFSAPRSYHRMVSGIEDAGFEIRDQIQWIFGSGFPKSHNLTGKFKGWGTGLKPGYEPICLARKPFKGSVADNMNIHSVGAINIDECRVHTFDGIRSSANNNIKGGSFNSDNSMKQRESVYVQNELGRWPANLIHDGSDEVLNAFPEASGAQSDVKNQHKCRQSPNGIFNGMRPAIDRPARIELDKSAARFFYCPKASRTDRNEGLGEIPPQFKHGSTLRDAENLTERKGNFHPTVKPTDIMRYLCRLVTPKGGTVLDPFTGSGSTGKAAILEGLKFYGIEREDKYIPIANARCTHALNTLVDKKPSRMILELV
ncbi:DNA-methyltransferase [Acinetobacter higginsii]|uniref:DNA-methyltransferase n=1 Tax=Acinetobacter higginsii TaxID=70347 RepID=UPI00300B71C0